MQVQPVVAGHSLVDDAQLVSAQAADRLWIDRAAMDPNQRRDDRCVLLRQVEPLGIEVKEAGIVLSPHDLPLPRGESGQAHQPQRDHLVEARIEPIGDDQYRASLA